MKPGIRTTEFWITAVMMVAITAGTVANVIPGKYSALIGGSSAGLYVLGRFILKLKGSPDIATALDALRTELADAGAEAAAKRATEVTKP